MLADIEIPIVIVGFGNAADIVKCLTAVGEQRGSPKIGVFICENGGAGAFDALIEALSSSGGPCAGEAERIEVDAPVFLRVRRLRLAVAGVPVFVAEASENLGFPGGVNSWIRLFLLERGWQGVWVLNPDTWPAPDALAELVRYADKRRKGMVQSRIMFADRSDITSSRGLKWHKFRAKQTGVDIFAPVSPAPDPDDHRTAHGFANGGLVLCDQGLHRHDRADGRLLLALLGRFRLGGSRQGGVRHRLRARFRRPAYRRQPRRAPPAGAPGVRSPLSISATGTSCASCASTTHAGSHGPCSCLSSEPASTWRPDRRATSPPR